MSATRWPLAPLIGGVGLILVIASLNLPWAVAAGEPFWSPREWDTGRPDNSELNPTLGYVGDWLGLYLALVLVVFLCLQAALIRSSKTHRTARITGTLSGLCLAGLVLFMGFRSVQVTTQRNDSNRAALNRMAAEHPNNVAIVDLARSMGDGDVRLGSGPWFALASAGCLLAALLLAPRRVDHPREDGRRDADPQPAPGQVSARIGILLLLVAVSMSSLTLAAIRTDFVTFITVSPEYAVQLLLLSAIVTGLGLAASVAVTVEARAWLGLWTFVITTGITVLCTLLSGLFSGFKYALPDDPCCVYPGPGMVVFLLANALLSISSLRIWRAATRTNAHPKVEQAR